MNIACYGFVEREAGSVASAGFLILEDLLKRGHTVTLYAIEGFVQPDEQLSTYSNFQYVGVRLEPHTRWIDRLPHRARQVVDRLVSDYAYRKHLRAIAGRLERDRQEIDYEVLLFLGVGAQFTVDGLPTVSWVQGPWQTEWEAIARLRKTVVRQAGWKLYTKLKGYYLYKKHVMRREYLRSDRVICGSRWSYRHVVNGGLPAHAVQALPYPIDLDLFSPNPTAAPAFAGRKTLLWLGRIDPRKRLDLMLEAFELLLQERRDVQLSIVGRFTYAPEYRRLIDAFPFPEHLSYREHIPREDVPALLQSVDVLVQPSESENFGSSVAEALCCGKPVVLGRTNGTADYTGEACFVFDTYTPMALKQALQAGLETLETQGSRLVDLARRTAEFQFASSNVGQALENLLQEAVREGTVQMKKTKPAAGLQGAEFTATSMISTRQAG